MGGGRRPAWTGLAAASLFASVAVAALAAAPAEAQPGDRVQRVGYLSIATRSVFHQVFEQTLGERGWVLGKNLVIVYRFADEKYERLPALAAELVRLEPQVIVAAPTASALAVKRATSAIPIVMTGVADPIGEGLIAGFARPGGNVTGLTSSLTWAGYAKQLQLLKDTVPGLRQIALLRDPGNPASLAGVETLTEAAKSLGIELQAFGARGFEDFEPVFRAMRQARAGAVVVHREAAFGRHLDRLAALAARHRLPSISAAPTYAKAGGLMTYAVDTADEARQVAGYVDRILRGSNPAELPVEQPSKFDLVINLKTAKALGITIPAPLVLQASQVLE